MTRPRVAIADDQDNPPRSCSSRNAAASAPNVTVEGSFVLEGNWVLRRYNNDCGVERLLLKRRTSQLLQIPRVESPKAPSAAQIVGPRANIVRDQPNRQKRANRQAQKGPQRAEPTADRPTGTSASQADAQSTSRKVVYHAALDEQGQNKKKKGSQQQQRVLFDPDTEMPSPKSTRNRQMPKPRLLHGSNLVVQEEGWVRSEKHKKGTWHFLTKARSRKASDYDQSGEGQASQKMGNKGHWQPDTLYPAAEDIHNFRECMRIRKVTSNASNGIEIVWVETKESHPSEEEEEQQDDDRQKLLIAAAAWAGTSYAADEPATVKTTNADSRASKASSKPPKTEAVNPGGMDYYRWKRHTASTKIENEAVVEHDGQSVHADQENIVEPESAAQPVPPHPKAAPVKTPRSSTRRQAESEDDQDDSPNGTKRKASADNDRSEASESEPESTHFHTLKGANRSYVDEATGSPVKRQRISEEPGEVHNSSPLTTPPESEHGELAEDAGSDDEEVEAEGESSRNPVVIEGGNESSNEEMEEDYEDDAE